MWVRWCKVYIKCIPGSDQYEKADLWINVTLDGCCDHTKAISDEEVHYYFADLLRDSDTLVYGRKTYQLMVPFWPDMAKSQAGPTASFNDFAQAFDAVDRIVVFSRTLESVGRRKQDDDRSRRSSGRDP